MNYDGPRLDVDPVQVWKTSWTDFPDMAASYASVSRVIETSRGSTEATGTEFFAKWSTARDIIQNALAYSASNTEATAAAIRVALSAYVETDARAAQALQAAAGTGDIDADKPLPPIDPQWGPDHRSPFGGGGAEPVPGPDGIGQCPRPMAPTDHDITTKAVRYYEVWQRAKRAELNDLHETLLDLGDHGYQDFGSGDIGSQILASGMPEPDGYQAAIDALPATDPLSATANGTALGLTSQAVARIESWLSADRWGGTTANNYRIEQLSRYEDIVANQTYAVSALKPLLSDFQLGVAHVRTDLGLLLEEAIDACQRIVDEQSVDVAQFITKALVTTITLGGAAVTGGATLALTGTTVVLQDSLTLNSKGSTADEVHENLNIGVTELLNGYKRFDEEMLSQAGTLVDNLETVDDAQYLRIPRPAFAGAPGSFLPSDVS